MTVSCINLFRAYFTEHVDVI